MQPKPRLERHSREDGNPVFSRCLELPPLPGYLLLSWAVIPCLTEPAPYLIRENPVGFSGYRRLPAQAGSPV